MEFAIIAPLLFLLVFGIIQFGLWWSEKNVYVGLAREGARFAAVRCQGSCGPGEVAAYIDSVTPGGYAVTGPVTVSPNPGCDSGDSGDPVTVTWSQTLTTLGLPFLPSLSGPVGIEATFRCE